MEEKIDQILLDYQMAIVKAVRTFTGPELLQLLDANRKLYVVKIQRAMIERTINMIEKGEIYGKQNK